MQAHGTTQRHPENRMLNERSQSQKVTFYDSIYMKCSEQAKLQRQKVD